MNKIIYVRQLFAVNNQVFQVGEKGSKECYDPVTRRTYGYASASNVKHCIKDSFHELSDVERLVKLYSKDADAAKKFIESGSGKQDGQKGVSCEIDVENPASSFFGAWNNTDNLNGGEKYQKATFMSAICVGQCIPLNPYLSSFSGNQGVNVGDENSEIVIIHKAKANGKMFRTPEEFAEWSGLDLAKCTDYFKNQRAMNFYDEKKTSTGIYCLDLQIHFDRLLRFNVNENPYVFTNGKLDELTANGWVITKKGKQTYISAPADVRKFYYKYLVESIYSWDFETNISLHGTPKEFLRSSFTCEDVTLWQEATSANVDFVNKTASIAINDTLEGVYSFNSKSLEKYMNCESINEPDFYAHKRAQEKLVELGNSIIDQY